MGFGGRGTLRAGQVQRSPSLKDLAHRLAVTQDTNSFCENIMSQERGLLVATNPPPVVKDAQLDRLREEREVHRHRQIWTKDAHGGPYKKVMVVSGDPSVQGLAILVRLGIPWLAPPPCSQVNDGKGYDPLLQTPDGKDKEVSGDRDINAWDGLLGFGRQCLHKSREEGGAENSLCTPLRGALPGPSLPPSPVPCPLPTTTTVGAGV